MLFCSESFFCLIRCNLKNLVRQFDQFSTQLKGYCEHNSKKEHANDKVSYLIISETHRANFDCKNYKRYNNIKMDEHISNDLQLAVNREQECQDELEYFAKKFLQSMQTRYSHDERRNYNSSSKRYNTFKANSMARDEELEYLSKQAEKNFASIRNEIRDVELEKLHQRSLQFLAWRDEQRKRENKV